MANNREIISSCIEYALDGIDAIGFDNDDNTNIRNIEFNELEIVISLDSGIDVVGNETDFYYQFKSKRSGTFTENNYWDLFDEIENMNY